MLALSLLTSLYDSVQAAFDKRDDVYILVMGRTGTGKTSFINTATDSHLAVGSTLSSRTHNIQLSRPFQFNSKRVILIDTPGLDGTTRSTEDVTRMVSAYLAKMRKRGRVVQGTIYFHRISDNRMGQVALQSLRAFQDMCNQEALHHIAVVLSMWEDVAPDVREGRKRALCERERYFKPLIEAGAVAFSHDRTHRSAHEVIQCLLRETPQTASVDANDSLFTAPVRPCPAPKSHMPGGVAWKVRAVKVPPTIVRLDGAIRESERGEKFGVPLAGHLEPELEYAKTDLDVPYGPAPKRPRRNKGLRRIAKAIKDFFCQPLRKQRMTAT